MAGLCSWGLRAGRPLVWELAPCLWSVEALEEKSPVLLSALLGFYSAASCLYLLICLLSKFILPLIT